MKDRFFRLSRLLSGALALLMMGGLTYSCSDDYDLDETYPSWLGSSIYDYLKDKGNFTNTIKLIDDLDYAEVLSKTGSKTLFVADDDAYTRFYANNSWGVRSYEDLTQSQKKLLLNSSMLDNAYLLEMMSSTTSSSRNEDGKFLNKNTCLRQPTSLTRTDSIGFYSWDSPAIPKTFNEGLKNVSGKPDIDYWARFRTQEKGGIRMATDGTVPMMIHWIAGQMGEKKITDGDFATIVGTTREPNDVYIYGSKVVNQDITCQNGYIDQLDNVFVTPSNMAEQIRTSSKTSIFSHMLDRFSAPYYSSSLTTAYRQLNPGVDSVFEKRYMSARSQGASRLERDPWGNSVTYYLSYDPGWNTYYNRSHGLQEDMGAMFIPSDQALRNYFIGGGGQFLMDAYATQKPVTEDNLLENLDQIPLDVIQALINNMMKDSFIESVPSKYITIMNDARDPMFSNCATVDEFKERIDTCLIANNGVVYVMNAVYTPARYASVSAPALVGDSLHIFNWAITADDRYISNPNSAPLNSFISSYLLAMSSNFSFFIPSDRALQLYYDPVSMAHSQPYALRFTYNTNSTANPVTARAYAYDKLTGEVDSVRMNTNITATIVNNRLKDMLDAHIIVDQNADKLGVYDGNEYYVSKGGAPIKVKDANAGVNGMKVYGGWQLDHGQECTVEEIFDKSEKSNGYGNGFTYIIDHPIQSTVNSVYSIMSDDENEDSPYYEFYQLCSADMDVLEEAGFADGETTTTKRMNALKKYTVFTSDNYPMDQNVRFFNTYRYTIYIPTNESVKEAISQGLPTWTSIAEYIQSRKDYIAAHENEADFDVETETQNYKTTAQAMVTCLLNFVKYHFQDNSVFVDLKATEPQDYETACINNQTNRYYSVTVQSAGNHTLTVTDLVGHTRNVITADGHYNMLARDMQLNAAGERSITINTSSFAVLHQIDGVLNFKSLTDGRYDSDWATPAAAKRFIAKYRIRN